MRALKFAIYAVLTVTGIAVVYHRLSFGLRGGVDDAAGWALTALWGTAGLYLVGYAFLLAAEALFDWRHRLTFDVAAFVVFCVAFAGRLLGL